MKSINKSAENLFICGHVQNIQFLEVDKFIYIKAKCLPEMRKDRVYILKAVLKARELDIVYVECGCPAGMGPKGICKHIAFYALADFSRYKGLPEYHTSTDMLQQWNRPRQRHVDVGPVDELGSCRRQLTPSIRSYGSGVVFDPRPTCFRESDSSVALGRLRCDLLDLDLLCDLLDLDQPCGILNIIVPSITKIDHDHCYHQLHHSQDQVINVHTSSNNSLSPISTDSFDEFKVKTITPEEVLAHLHLTPEKRLILEKDTRGQSVCPNWYEACRICITGSKCGRIIAQKQKTVALLRFF